MFSSVLIDSLKLRIRLDECKIIDQRIIQKYIEYYPKIDGVQLVDQDTGQTFECVETIFKLGDAYKNSTGFIDTVNGITYRIYIKSYIGNDNLAHEYIVFGLSAKMCKKDYFKGLTHESIDSILQDINNYKIVEISKKVFLDALISDIDICTNFKISMPLYKSALHLITRNIVQGKRPLVRLVQKKTDQVFSNLGLQFHTRENATNTCPHIKIYHKGLELQSKSLDFYKAYLEPMQSSDLDRLIRFEFTIKTSKHKQFLKDKLNIQSPLKTLNDVLNASQNDLKIIILSAMPHYTEKTIKQKSISNLTPTEIYTLHFIKTLIHLGADRETIMAFQFDFPQTASGAVQKSTTKSKIKKILDSVLSFSDDLRIKELNNSECADFLRSIGVLGGVSRA